MTHILPPINNDTIASLMHYNNVISDGWFGGGIVIAVFVISFFTLKAYPADRAFAAASFLTAIVAILFRVLDILSGIYMYGSIILALLGLVWLYTSEKRIA